MCGILGTIPALNSRKFEHALNTLTHRGPDDQGIWTDISGSISLGHRRLSILDLTQDGRQPMVSKDGDLVLVFNGEIYNFVEIKKELEAKGHRFCSQSDTEVLLAAYREWKEKSLLKLNGMWSFAVWDRKEKSLFLARDRFGKKPLFYAYVNGSFIFASEMKAIYPFLPTVKPSSDFTWMKNNIFLYEATDKCLIDGIKRFPAGHYGLYRNGTMRMTRYWNTLDNLVEVPQDYPSQVERFRELFLDSIKIRMRSDVPVGTALSGGLDSSAVISSMAAIGRSNHVGNRISKDWQHAFVACFPGTFLDETYYAKKVVEHLDIKAEFIEIDPLANISRFEYDIYRFEELYITSAIPMIETYRAVKNKGVSVTVDGHGADELLCGYNYSLPHALPDAGINILDIIGILETYRQSFPEDWPERKRSRLIQRYPRHMLRYILNKFGGAGATTSDELSPTYENLDNLNKHLYGIFHTAILPTLLRNYDRYSMMNGVEIRMPFMDHRLVSYSLSLPWNSKIRKRYSKSILRDAIASLLPSEVTYRKTKIGFNSPFSDWIRGPLKELFMDHIHSQRFNECDLINPQMVRDSVEKVIQNKDAHFSEGEQVWTTMYPYFWELALSHKYYLNN